MRLRWAAVMSAAVLLAAPVSAQRDEPPVGPAAPNTSAARLFPGESNGNAPAGSVSKIAMRALLYSGANTRVLARFMPWFDAKGHSAAGYRSDDPAQVRAQVEDMRSRGIDVAAVAWYGPEDKFKDRVTELLVHEAERTDGAFQVVLSYSGTLGDCAKKHCDPTDRLVSELNYAADHYFSSPAYLHVRNRPVLFFFDLEKFSIDWREVRAHVHGRPLFLFRNPSGFDHAESDGAYSWIEPTQASGSDPAGLAYLRRFYQAARRHPDKIAVGSVYKGFDDSLAGWGKNRHLQQDCGKTWLATWDLIEDSFDARHQLPFVIVVTWNDYEEGTEIETGIENCVSLSARLRGSALSWELNGNRDAVDHFAIFAGDGRQLRHLTDVAPDSRRISLGGTLATTAVVEAVGKPSFVNHFATAVQEPGGEARRHQVGYNARP